MQHDFPAIWQQFNPAISELVCRKVKHDDICQDILQELYIKVFTHMDRVMGAADTKAYLMRLAHNMITDHYRSINRQPHWVHEEALAQHAHEAEKQPEYQLADRYLRPIIATLPAIYRDALILTELEGLTQQQLAGRLGISLPAAKSRVQRAREKLKEQILQCCNYRFDKYGNIISCCGN